MALLPAWAVDGGRVPAAMARRETFASTSGATGIVLPTDLRVTALPTPGAAVRVMPGSAVMVNRYPGAVGESYSVANDSALDVSVPATDSSGPATRYVILRVSDPQFGGQEPDDPLEDSYTSAELVSSVTGLAYPHVVLARIDQPASTATITQEMIVDERAVANPRTEYVQRSYNMVSSETEVLTNTSEGGENYPNAAAMSVPIPQWATRMSVIATWAAVRYRGGNTFGRAWLEFGPPSGSGTNRLYKTQEVSFDSDDSTNVQRTNWICPDTVPIHESIRGTTQQFRMRGRLNHGTGNARPQMDGVSGVVLQLQFLEDAV